MPHPIFADQILGMSGEGWAQLAQVLLVVVTAFGILPSLWRLLKQRKREERQRALSSYNQMADKWSDFLALSLQYPDLGAAPLALDQPSAMPPSRLLLYSALIQLLNRAYVTYRNEPEAVLKDRYKGWENYLCALLDQDEFAEAWDLLGYGYDEEFVKYVKKLQQGDRLVPLDESQRPPQRSDKVQAVAPREQG